MSRAHPLSKNPGYYFSQWGLAVNAPFLVSKLGGESSSLRINAAKSCNSCRETVIGNIRSVLRSKVRVFRREPKPGRYWNQTSIQTHNIILDGDAIKQPDLSWMGVSIHHLIRDGRRCVSQTRPAYIKEVRQFLQLSDATVGLMNVLLNPDRYTGNWWRTSIEEAQRARKGVGRGYLGYYGVDNTMLRHPALISLYLGVLRQNAFIVRADAAVEALDLVDRKNVTKALTNSDPKLALKLLKDISQWVAVPVARGGLASNFPVGLGTFKKVVILHKAIYKQGLDEVFGAPEQAWTLLGGEDTYGSGFIYDGIHSWMGIRGNSQRGEKIKKLAA